jgi:ribosomal protein L36
MGEEVLHEGWSSYDNLSRSSCDNCHGVRRKTIVYTAKHTSNMVIFIFKK